ncbi:MAG: ABC transporter substrate-binding protein [Phycisphaerales bacterium]|nr:ABC transporter substrate-binding protein [Phycisphaerales bacterium]
MTKKILFTIGVVAAVAIGVFVYLNKTDKTTETVKIGAVLPLTGNLAFLGETGKNGLTLAENYINTNHLLNNGQQVKFVLSDGAGVPKTSINALNHLLDAEQVKMVFSIVSSVDVSFIPIQKDRNFLFVSHATHPALSGVGPLFFRHSPTVEQEANLLKQHIGNDAPSIVLLNMSDDYGVAFAKIATQEEFILPANIFTFNPTEQDFRTICTRAIQSNPNKVVICGNGKDLYRIVIALRQLGYKNEIIATLGFKVGGAFEQVKDSAIFTYVDFKKPVIDSKYSGVLKEYYNQYHKEMNVNEMIFFNSALLLVEAINRSTDKNDVSEIAKKLSDMGPFSGLGENMAISAMHDILPELEILTNNNDNATRNNQ